MPIQLNSTNQVVRYVSKPLPSRIFWTASKTMLASPQMLAKKAMPSPIASPLEDLAGLLKAFILPCHTCLIDRDDARFWPGPTNGGMAAVSLPAAAKRCIPVTRGQDARYRASSGRRRHPPFADSFLTIRPTTDLTRGPLSRSARQILGRPNPAADQPLIGAIRPSQ